MVTQTLGWLTDAPARGDYTLKNDGPVGRVIHKPDLAAILVSCLKKDEHVGHAMGMGYPQYKIPRTLQTCPPGVQGLLTGVPWSYS
ncbi:hypothetical protein LAZ67_2006515 [Cordylochernes scorpioides]|uniref:Uncharacterized protein n=1 Tax=Cordylochernes scorpioides TaxID=51811 RepID=A0ABY6K9Z3_9ARAC|nr:hypothetical protein LAZ67_2006515 [Cordylochernes scorpioides]